jgi:hypothetical protein
MATIHVVHWVICLFCDIVSTAKPVVQNSSPRFLQYIIHIVVEIYEKQKSFLINIPSWKELKRHNIKVASQKPVIMHAALPPEFYTLSGCAV